MIPRLKMSFTGAVGILAGFFPSVASGEISLVGNSPFYEEDQIREVKSGLPGTYLFSNGSGFSVAGTGSVGIWSVSPVVPADTWENSIKFKCVIFTYEGKLWADLYMEGGPVTEKDDMSEEELELVRSGVHYLVRVAIDPEKIGLSSAKKTLMTKLPKEGIKVDCGLVIVNVKALKPAGAMKELAAHFPEPAMLYKKEAKTNKPDKDSP
jgi:hypothetical protein